MTRYLLSRILLVLPTLIGTSIIVFVLARVLPGDPARLALGERASTTELERLRDEMGLDRPLIVQYGRFMRDLVVRGDLGRSFRTRNSIGADLKKYFPATAELAVASMLVALVVGVSVGIAAGTGKSRVADILATGVGLVGVSVPVFWLGMILIFGLGFRWNLLPFDGRVSVIVSIRPLTNFYLLDTLLAGDFAAFRNVCAHLILPALTLATIPAAFISRITRSAMSELLHEDFVRTARAKGLPEHRVFLIHVFRNALISVTTASGSQFGYLLSGAVLTETIFQWPGLGRYVVDSVAARDLPAVQGAVLLIAVVFVAVNLCVDLCYFAIDPRVRAGTRADTST